jgi:hypothetical protein
MTTARLPSAQGSATPPLDFRLTVGLRKLDGAWIVEHTSTVRY